MTGLDQVALEAEVAHLLTEAISTEQFGLAEPKSSDFHNRAGTGRYHYPEPYEPERITQYDRAMEAYNERCAARKAAERSEAEARQLLSQQPLLRLRICEALKSVNEDTKDLAKIVCTALVSLSIAGTIVLPVTPLLCAGVGLVAWRAGTNGFCAGASGTKK
jgi:hypothetical protein